MAAVVWRLFSLSVVTALLGAQAAFAQASYGCVNDAPDPYQQGTSFAPLRPTARYCVISAAACF
jgi:hypothetical protein